MTESLDKLLAGLVPYAVRAVSSLVILGNGEPWHINGANDGSRRRDYATTNLESLHFTSAPTNRCCASDAVEPVTEHPGTSGQ